MKKICIIPARGNSVGIPKKNLYLVGGKPLLSYTIAAAQSAAVFDEVIVSSESAEILDYSRKLGAATDLRPLALSEHAVHAVHVVLEFIERASIAPESHVAMLLPTSPLRSAQDIQGAYQDFCGSSAESLVSVCLSEKHLANFRTITERGFLAPIAGGPLNVQRQDMPALYAVNGSIYFSSAAALRRHKSFHLGDVLPYVMPRLRSFDINSLENIEEVERVLKI